MERIPKDDVIFDTYYPHLDTAGRVFRWQGELYRGINAAWAPMFSQLLQDGTIQGLVDQGLFIETELTNFTLDGFDLIVHHRTIPFVSYPWEWCAAMLRDAALLTIDLSASLVDHGLTLVDAHGLNVLFDGSKPIHIDLTSIIPTPKIDVWRGYKDFCQHFLYPLLLISHGREELARCLLGTRDGVLRTDFLRLAPTTAQLLAMNLIKRELRRLIIRLQPHRRGDPQHLITHLREVRALVEKISLPVGISRSHNNVDGTDNVFRLELDSSNTEQQVIHKVVTDLQPKTVLHIGGDTAFWPILAACAGSSVVVFETRPEAATQLYRQARREKLPILTMMLDFLQATTSYGTFEQSYAGVVRRFQCDMVLLPNLINSLDETQKQLSHQQIVDVLALWSKRWVVIGDTFTQTDDNTNPLSIDHLPTSNMRHELSEVLERKFRKVEVIPFESRAGAWFICEK